MGSSQILIFIRQTNDLGIDLSSPSTTPRRQILIASSDEKCVFTLSLLSDCDDVLHVFLQ